MPAPASTATTVVMRVFCRVVMAIVLVTAIAVQGVATTPAQAAAEMVTANPNARPDRIPIGRFGLPDEVADVALMLARNGYITGQTINVNGGWYMS